MIAAARVLERSLTFARPELLKWSGLACMVADHYGLIFGVQSMATEVLGALALPFFTFALAYQVAAYELTDQKLVDIAKRCVVFGIAAQVAMAFVLPSMLLNILFTIAVGVWLAVCLRRGGYSWLLPVICSLFVDAGPFGVAFVGLTIHAVTTRLRWAELSALTAYLSLWLVQGMAGPAALLAAPLAYLFSLAPVDLPRVRGIFYWLYVLQWPVLGVAATLFAAPQ